MKLPTFPERARGRLNAALVALAALTAAIGVGWLAATEPQAAGIIVLAVLMAGVVAIQPGLLPLAALPLIMVVTRVGAAGVDLSVSDVALAAAAVPAAFLAKRPFSPGLRAVLWADAAYQFATLVTVVNNPYAANAIEWAHAGMTVAGALLVGWAVGMNGHAKVGIRLLVGTIGLLSVITIVQGAVQVAAGDYGPVYVSWPYEMHKNFVGTACALGACIVYVRPAWAGISRRASFTLLSLMLAAVLLSQSRQAVIGLVSAVFVLVFRSNAERRRSKLVLLFAVPMSVFVTSLVQDQITSGNQFNSVYQRLTWFEDSIDVWSTDPWFGVGLRWWYTDRFPVRFQPPNAEVEVLSSGGILGLVAFIVLIIVALRVAWRLDPTYGSVALAVLVNRLAQAQFDLFWAAVQGSLPFVVLGLCLGAHRYQELQAAMPGVARRELPARAGAK